jgi:hypothetical protein
MSALRPRRTESLASCTATVAHIVGALLVVALSFPVAPRQASAQQPDSQRLMAPIEDLLSASSWLAVSGRDPRYPASGSVAAWDIGLAPTAATPVAANPDAASAPPEQIVTRQLGLVPVNAEPSLAVDPLDPNHLVLGVSALDLPSVATYVSFDAGATWDGPVQVPYFPLDAVSIGGPIVAFDSEGVVYLVSRSVTFDLLSFDGRQERVPRSRIAISKSTDGGLSWGDAVSLGMADTDIATATDETGQTASTLRQEFLDWPSIAIGPDPQNPERQIITIAYTELSVSYGSVTSQGATSLSPPTTESTIHLVRSTDGGETWTSPIPVSTTAIRGSDSVATTTGAALPDAEAPSADPLAGPPVATDVQGDQVVQGPHVAVLPDGVIVVAYYDSTGDGPHQGLARVMVTSSTDGGRTFAEPTPAGIVPEISRTPRTAFFRWWSGAFPRVAVGPHGEIFVAVTAKPFAGTSDDGDVILFRSLDGGSTWDPTIALGDAAKGHQFFPAITIAPDGTLHAIWGDMGDDPHGVTFTVYHARSLDSGVTWSTRRVSDGASNTLLGYPGGLYLGDRFAIAATDDAVSIAWAQTGTPGSKTPGQQVAFSSVPSGDE